MCNLYSIANGRTAASLAAFALCMPVDEPARSVNGGRDGSGRRAPLVPCCYGISVVQTCSRVHVWVTGLASLFR